MFHWKVKGEAQTMKNRTKVKINLDDEEQVNLVETPTARPCIDLVGISPTEFRVSTGWWVSYCVDSSCRFEVRPRILR